MWVWVGMRVAEEGRGVGASDGSSGSACGMWVVLTDVRFLSCARIDERRSWMPGLAIALHDAQMCSSL